MRFSLRFLLGILLAAGIAFGTGLAVYKWLMADYVYLQAVSPDESWSVVIHCQRESLFPSKYVTEALARDRAGKVLWVWQAEFKSQADIAKAMPSLEMHNEYALIGKNRFDVRRR